MPHTDAIPPESEASLQSKVVKAAALFGWTVFSVRQSAAPVGKDGRKISFVTSSGYPDLTMVHPTMKRVIFAELKSADPKARLSVAQEDWLAKLEAAGQEAYVWRPKDWDTIVRVLMAFKLDAAAICMGCGKRYTPRRRPQSGRRNFCQDCGKRASDRIRTWEKRHAAIPAGAQDG